ncbi:aminotransferase class V-fold PLP-dependent enzyme [Kutzneria kofuensis]|uniref:Selenocysteine lyase/cysteine desulfurase n=1 Tax=Kutzneria kofuensis TaxID=103725 RepID=A0A7W9KNX6_9PSEU|nr:aminotransferase class V-fold PLP-dependent enzyme [Kutzneria kofuensis]MBB5896021.1 selenocysteine lyase/cysteine desulfurase [Kutzneria kofuensis]
MNLSPAAFRARFPMLGNRVHLASCSLGARSLDLDDALRLMLDDMADGGAPWDRFEDQLHQARQGFAALVGARVEQIAVVPNASVGAYQVASTMDFGRRPKIVTTDLEFPSVAHVWLAQRPRGAEVVYGGEIDQATRLVSVPMTGYQYGERLPVADIARRAHDAGAEVFVDAYQAIGTEPVDVDRLGCDYLVAGTMKYLLGLPGLAFLYVRSPARTDRDPRLTGWFGRVDPFAFDPRTLDFAATATRFETGTPSVPAAYTANAGLRLIARTDLAAVRDHILGLTDLAIDLLTAQGRQVHALPRERRGAHIGLVDPDPIGLAKRLAAHGIAVSPRGDVVRLSFHHYSTTEDIDALCAALSRIER